MNCMSTSLHTLPVRIWARQEHSVVPGVSSDFNVVETCESYKNANRRKLRVKKPLDSDKSAVIPYKKYDFITKHILIDTGALQANYVNVDTAKWLMDNGAKPTRCKSVVCSGLSNTKCSSCLGKINFSLEFFNESKNNFETIFIIANIVDIKEDIIIGRPTIIREKLLYKCYSHFQEGTTDDLSARAVRAPLGRGVFSTPPEKGGFSSEVRLFRSRWPK